MDPVSVLNRVFPSTDELGTRQKDAREYTEKCREYLKAQIQLHPSPAELKAQAPDLMGEFATLQSETRQIQQLGASTLSNVKLVTTEINKLDVTKENLMSSIRLLRQLKMLTKLYLQLDILLRERRYEDMVSAVQAASDLTDYFRRFRPLPQISKLSQEIGEMETKVYDQIEKDFETDIHPSGSNTFSKESCVFACQVLDSLDAAVGENTNRDRLIKFYCDRMLVEYISIFSPKDEAGSLENVQRRFAYLKNKVVLRYLAQHSQLFPPHWPVRKALTEACCELTTSDLLEQLPKVRSGNGEQVQTLLSTIHESTEFEHFVKQPGLISKHLVPYLSIWVDFQSQQIAQRISGYSRSLVMPEKDDEVISSSRELVNFYRALLQQFDQIPKGETDLTFQFAEVMATNLGRYGTQVLSAYLPQQLASVEDVRLVKVVNATADYVLGAASQLARSFDQEDLFESRALSNFRQVSIKVEALLVQYVQRMLEPLWLDLAHQYTSNAKVGTSDVSRVSIQASQLVGQLRNLLLNSFSEPPVPSPALIYGIVTRTATAVSTDFLTVAMARVAKPLHESTVEQMLLDLGSLKTQGLLAPLEEIPAEIRESKGASRLERLPQRVLETVAQAEAVLKVLLTPADPMETFVCNYLLLVKDNNTLNFRKILDVKGVRFQPRAMEKFRLMASQETGLSEANMLLKSIPTVVPAEQQSFGFKRIGDFFERRNNSRTK